MAATTREGTRRLPAVLPSVALGSAILAAVAFMALTGRPGALGAGVADSIGGNLQLWLSLQFMVLMAAIFVAEYRFPARDTERGITPAVLLDALYMGIQLPVAAAVFAFASEPVSAWLEANASWLIIDSTRGWPVWLAGLVGLLIIDFGAFVAHVLKHKIGFLWRFHMIHHGQTRLNAFTANRTHVLDSLFDHVLLLAPFFVLFPSFTAEAGNVFVLSLVGFWITKFQHANIRTTMGPLRYIFVSPQSHRVHHSARPDHWNSNYGNIFAWDRLFGTQHSDITSYPPTGIGDESFPEPMSWSPVELARGFVGQLLYPFDRAAVRIASDPSAYAHYDEAASDDHASAGAATVVELGVAGDETDRHRDADAA